MLLKLPRGKLLRRLLHWLLLPKHRQKLLRRLLHWLLTKLHRRQPRLERCMLLLLNLLLLNLLLPKLRRLPICLKGFFPRACIECRSRTEAVRDDAIVLMRSHVLSVGATTK